MAERELTGPVTLCNGRTLAPGARGWLRHPTLDANLQGAWGRKKRWDYWCVITPELVVSMVVADIDYAGLAGCWILDRSDHRQVSVDLVRPLARGISLPDRVCTGTVEVDTRSLRLSIDESEARTSLRATAPRSNRGPVDIAIDVAKPPAHESLNVVIPWSDRKFQFTSKQHARPATGTVTVGDRSYDVGTTEAFAIQDLGRGIWPYANQWNWGAASGRAIDGRLVGLQFGGKWTVGTGHTENAVSVDGVITKISSELTWTYDWDDPMRPWRVSGDGVDVTLTPSFDRYDNTNLGVLKMEVHQCFGSWSGTFETADGETVELKGIDGFAEEARNRW